MVGGKPARDKGIRIERQIVALHESIGVHAERVPLSGAVLYRGNSSDIDIYPWGEEQAPLLAEVKARHSGAGFALLERWLGDADLLFLRRDRADLLVCMPWQIYVRLLGR